MPWIFTIGDCDLSMELYNRNSCFRTTSYWSYSQTCTINVEKDCELIVKSFYTVENDDTLEVNGIAYSGNGVSQSPHGMFVPEGEEIEFSADASTFVRPYDSEFDICATSSAPSDSDDSDSTTLLSNGNMYIIIAGVLFLCCLCTFFFARRSQKKNDRRVDGAEGRRNRRQQAQGGEGAIIPKEGLLPQQSIEGAVQIGMVEPGTRPKGPNVRSESDNLRPVFSFSEQEEILMPSFESDLAAIGEPPADVKEDLPELPSVELAPPAELASQSNLAALADIAPPADVPPPYDPEAPPDYEPEEGLGEGKQGVRRE